MAVKVIEISLPEYHIKEKPAYLKLGQKVDKVIEENFPDGKYILRAISLDEHKDISLDQLAEIVIKTGTDKYDQKRKGVEHDKFLAYDYDTQAGTITIKNGKLVIPKTYKYTSEFADIVWHFYEHAPYDRGYPVRIDMLIVYDAKMLTKAIKVKEKPEVRKELTDYLYKFNNPEEKKEALIGVIKILR